MKILFVEPRYVYDGIIDEGDFIGDQLFFSGYKYYKENKDFFLSYDAVISIQYLWPICNVVVLKARKYGISTYLLSDGVVEWANCFHHKSVIKSNTVLFSNKFNENLLCPGVFESKFMFGSHNGFNFVPKKILPSFSPNCDINLTYIKNKIPVVLITTANTAYFNEREKQEVISLIQVSIEELKRKNVSIKLRIFDDEILNSLISDGIDNDISSSFDELLSTISHLITTPSSIILTAMMANKPTCQMLYRDNPILTQSGWFIHKSCSIEESMQSFLSICEKRMSFQNSIVKNNYPDFSVKDTIRSVSFSKEVSKVDIESEYLKLLESRYNINFEFIVRKIYRKIIKIIKIIK